MTRRPWLWPLVPLYAAGHALTRAFARALARTPRRLKSPVISVGSLSAGGAGKTPVVLALAALLADHGWHPDILSRGYGRASTTIEAVDPTLPNAATRFGDEPVLLAQRSGVPVYVGADRHAAGLLAESQSPHPRHLHILDDGFQHRRLARTIDLVLLTAEDLDDALLPAGNRREPLSALRRANVILLREDEAEAITPRLPALLKPNTPIWLLRRTLRFPAPLGVLSAGLRPIAFCAIARPENFAAMLLDHGCGIAETIAFPDHHTYAAPDLDRILEVARGLNATGLITTEKDAVKLSSAARGRLSTIGPMVVVALDVSFLYPERVARELAERLQPAPQVVTEARPA